MTYYASWFIGHACSTYYRKTSKETLGFDINMGERTEFIADTFTLGLRTPFTNSSEDFARHQYTNDGYLTTAFTTVLNDNQTTIGHNNTAIQMEYRFKPARPLEQFYSNPQLGLYSNATRHGLVIWTISGGLGYQFNYVADEDQFSSNIPPIRKMRIQ
jgi:hypothetical protein